MREVNPRETTRAYAFEMWMKAPMPMVTFFKTLDVSRLVKISRKKRLKFNMLMCWCIGRAASQVKEFYMLPVGDKLIRYDSIAVNTIVANSQGEVSSCDIIIRKTKRATPPERNVPKLKRNVRRKQNEAYHRWAFFILPELPFFKKIRPASPGSES